MRWAACAAVVTLGCASHASEPAVVGVLRGDLTVGVEVSGVLEAADSTDVKPPPLPNMWNFKLVFLAPEGSEIKAGQPLVAFDSSDQVRELENMQNEADAAEKSLAKKRDEAQLAQRDQELRIAEAEAALRKASLKTDAPADLVASVEQRQLQLDHEAARLALDAARNRADQVRRSDAEAIARLAEKAAYAKRRVAELQGRIARLEVPAPRAGTVVYPLSEQGEKPKIGDSVWRMQNVAQIVGLGSMIGNGEVDEVDLARLSERQPVVLRLDAVPDVQLQGTVAGIAKSVQAKAQTDPSKIVRLKIAIAPTQVPLRPGMRFRGQVETAQVKGAVLVPAEAVFVTPEGPVAYKQTGGGFVRVPLRLGQRSAIAIEVVSGLAPGDRVARSDPELAR